MNNNQCLIMMKEKSILLSYLILSVLFVVSNSTEAQVYISLSINQPSPLISNIGTDKTICTGENTVIGGTTTGGQEPYDYIWSPSTGLSSATVATPVASPSVTTIYSLKVTDANNCTSSNSLTITVDPCSTGVNIFSTGTNYFSIVPNPSHGLFSVILPSVPVNKPVILEVFNFLGKRIYSGSFADTNVPLIIPIDIAGMDKGIYLVKVFCENATYCEKLIKE